ncbi:MAG: hypothetical protein RI935_368 [Candidatus Parcubacteria bacterium]|jgi:hypothetical protein
MPPIQLNPSDPGQPRREHRTEDQRKATMDLIDVDQVMNNKEATANAILELYKQMNFGLVNKESAASLATEHFSRGEMIDITLIIFSMTEANTSETEKRVLLDWVDIYLAQLQTLTQQRKRDDDANRILRFENPKE